MMSRRLGPGRQIGPKWCPWHGRWPYLSPLDLGQMPVRLAPGVHGSESLGRSTHSLLCCACSLPPSPAAASSAVGFGRRSDGAAFISAGGEALSVREGRRRKNATRTWGTVSFHTPVG